MRWMMFLAVPALLGGMSLQAAEADVVIADFEGKDYGDWKTTGEAFGCVPSRSRSLKRYVVML